MNNNCRLFSLARPSDQEHLLVDPEMNPESVSNFFSVITGKKSLMQRWEVSACIDCMYIDCILMMDILCI